MTTVFRRPTQNNYFASKRTWMQDERLCLKTTGLLAKMLSMPTEWEFHQSQLIKIMPDGEESLRTAFKDAAKYGYLIKLPQERNKDGKFSKQIYEVYDEPQFDEPLSNDFVNKLFSNNPSWSELKERLPKRGFPEPANPGLEDITKKEKNNTQVDNLREERQASLPVVEKKKILEKSFPDLQPQQVMQLSKNFTERDLRLAAEYALLQEKIEHPYSWISKCIRGKWWESADQAQMKGASLFDSLKTAIFALQTKIGTNLGIYASKDYLSFNTPIGGFSIRPENLTSDERIKTLVEAINDSLRFNFKLCYVNLSAQKGFEIL